MDGKHIWNDEFLFSWQHHDTRQTKWNKPKAKWKKLGSMQEYKNIYEQ